MPKTLTRIVLALSAFFVLAFTVAACGGDDDSSGDVPSNAVAVVGDEPITKADYDKVAELTAKGAAAQGGSAIVPDPPEYTECIAELRRTQRRPARGTSPPSDAALRARCRQMDTQLRQTVMQTLINAAWLVGEARELSITVTDDEVERRLEETKRAAFPRRGDYERFLRQSGMTNADVLERLREQLYQQKIIEKIQGSAAPVTEQQIEDYYRRNRAQFALPERRDVEIVLTRTEGEAEDAKAAIEGGMRWSEAARDFSTDALSKANGGKLLGVARGQQDRALDNAAFSARQGVVVGPVRGQFGWYVLRVTRVTPPEQDTLAEARAQIRQLLEQQAGQAKLSQFAGDFQRRWLDATTCRAGYVIPQLCKNAPRPRATSTAGGTVAAPSTSGDE